MLRNLQLQDSLGFSRFPEDCGGVLQTPEEGFLNVAAGGCRRLHQAAAGSRRRPEETLLSMDVARKETLLSME